MEHTPQGEEKAWAMKVLEQLSTHLEQSGQG
jgi:hypothetical protein